LATVEFVFHNKVHTATKSSPFQVNYGREPRMGFEIRKKEEACESRGVCKENEGNT